MYNCKSGIVMHMLAFYICMYIDAYVWLNKAAVTSSGVGVYQTPTLGGAHARVDTN